MRREENPINVFLRQGEAGYPCISGRELHGF